MDHNPKSIKYITKRHTGTRHTSRLTELKLKSIKNKPGRYSDGGGLQLRIEAPTVAQPSWRRTWTFRYRDQRSHTQRDKGLGPWTETFGLTHARRQVEVYRAKMAADAAYDPIDSERVMKHADRVAKAQAKTFGECVQGFWRAHASSWRNEKHAAQVLSTLEGYAKPLLPLPVAEIGRQHVLMVLEPIWQSKTETATRVRQRIENVLDWATARDYRQGDNPARWRGHLDKLLPKPTKLKKVKHHPALDYVEVHDFMIKLKARDGLGARALELQILTASRPGEVCGATWAEFDLKAKVWTVPGERMKAGREHRVPLSNAALELLAALEEVRDGEFVFAATRGKPLTTAAPLKHLQALRPGLHAHGFRSTFRDWIGDRTAFPRELAEQQLAHVLKDKSEAAYRRKDAFDKRAVMMEEWAKWCDTPAPVENAKVVVAIGSKRA